MSLKSRRKAEKYDPFRTKGSPLAYQKEMIRWSMMQYFGGFLVLFLLLIFTFTTVVFHLNHPESNFSQKSSILLLWVIVGGVSLYYILSFFRRLSLYRRIKEIQFASEEVVTIDCRKVRNFETPKGRYSSVSTYMILEDTAGKRYYYIYPRKNKNSWIHNSFDTNVKGKRLSLICYQNTNLIKFPPQEDRDPHIQQISADPGKAGQGTVLCLSVKSYGFDRK